MTAAEYNAALQSKRSESTTQRSERLATLARIYNLLSDPTDYDAIDNARTLLYNLIMESK